MNIFLSLALPTRYTLSCRLIFFQSNFVFFLIGILFMWLHHGPTLYFDVFLFFCWLSIFVVFAWLISNKQVNWLIIIMVEASWFFFYLFMVYETKTTFFVQVLYWSISQFMFLILVCDCNFKKCTYVLILLGPNPKIAHFGSEKPHTAHHSLFFCFVLIAEEQSMVL